MDLQSDRVVLRKVQRSGFREYYNPITGEGEGEKDFSWSALAAIM